jgi:hypothetical protein
MLENKKRRYVNCARAKTRNPLTKRLVATGSPLIILNLEILVVKWVKLFIAINPMTKQIALEIKARTNQRNREAKKSEGTATNLTTLLLFN